MHNLRRFRKLKYTLSVYLSRQNDMTPFGLPEPEASHWIDPDGNPHMLLGSAITDVVFEKDERGNAL